MRKEKALIAEFLLIPALLDVIRFDLRPDDFLK